ncbi:MAG: hypothetical protein LKM31_06425 [Sphingobium sp.]|jgi:hypothetical protein|nr:hypothetical protein [Sphingobium sp.]
MFGHIGSPWKAVNFALDRFERKQGFDKLSPNGDCHARNPRLAPEKRPAPVHAQADLAAGVAATGRWQCRRITSGRDARGEGDAVVLCDDATGEWAARGAIRKRDVVLECESAPARARPCPISRSAPR